MPNSLRDAPPHHGTPLCLGCLQPVDPLLHYCPHCSHSVGQHTPTIPFVNIPWQMEFWERAWQLIWTTQPIPVWRRVACVLIILITYPVMFIGIPLALYRLWEDAHNPPGVEVPNPHALPPTDPPSHPSYEDRPPRSDPPAT